MTREIARKIFQELEWGPDVNVLGENSLSYYAKHNGNIVLRVNFDETGISMWSDEFGWASTTVKEAKRRLKLQAFE